MTRDEIIHYAKQVLDQAHEKYPNLHLVVVATDEVGEFVGVSGSHGVHRTKHMLESARGIATGRENDARHKDMLVATLLTGFAFMSNSGVQPDDLLQFALTLANNITEAVRDPTKLEARIKAETQAKTWAEDQ